MTGIDDQKQETLNLQKQRVLAPHDESVLGAVVSLLRHLLETTRESHERI